MKEFQVRFAITFTLTLFLSISAQEIIWLKRFDTGRLDYLTRGALDPSGNLIISGVTGDYGARDITLIKYNPDGETLWTRTYDGGSDEVGLDCVIGNDGGVVVCGHRHPVSYLLVKYNHNGELVWVITDTIGELLPNLNSVAVDDSLIIYASGNTINSEGVEDWLFLKYSGDGSLLQRQVFDLGYLDWETINSFAMLLDGNFTGIGTVGHGEPPVLNLMIIKFTRTGDTLWTRLLDIKPQDDGYDIAVDSEGSIYITGDGYEEWGQGIVQPDSFVTARYQPDGTLDWVRVYGLSDFSWGTAIEFDHSGQVLVGGGGYDSILNESSGVILCYSPDGRLQWHWQFRQDNWNCWFDDIVIAEPGVCYVIGEVANANYDTSDFLVMKLRYPSWVAEEGPATKWGRSISVATPVQAGAPLRFFVPFAGDYRMSLLDVSGREMVEVCSGYLPAGENHLPLPSLPEGVYFLAIKSGGLKTTSRLVVVK